MPCQRWSIPETLMSRHVLVSLHETKHAPHELLTAPELTKEGVRVPPCSGMLPG